MILESRHADGQRVVFVGCANPVQLPNGPARQNPVVDSLPVFWGNLF
jgi:hypothetical protein